MRALALLVCLFFASVSSASVLPFSLEWMNDGMPLITTTYDSVDHPDGVFVVEAYFLGCPYCNDNAPNVNDMADAYKDEPRVQVLDVGIDRSSIDYDSWILRHIPNHPVLKDSSRGLVRQLGTSGYPSTYVIDCHGDVVFQSTGVWGRTTTSRIRGAIDDLLTQSCQ